MRNVSNVYEARQPASLPIQDQNARAKVSIGEPLADLSIWFLAPAPPPLATGGMCASA